MIISYGNGNDDDDIKCIAHIAVSLPAHGSRGLGLAGLEVAALPRGAGGVGEDGAGGGVAARVVAVVLQAAVALLPRLHEAVTTDRAVEQSAGLVTEAVVHTWGNMK